MKKFRFKFEALENVRKMRENEAMRVLAESQRAFHAAVAQKDRLNQNLSEALVRRESLAIEPVGPNVFALENDFITGTKQRIIQAEQGILRARRGVEKSLRSYLAARRQTRAIEILREKAFEEFKKERARKEQKEMDDLYVMRARFAEREREGA